MNWRDEFRAIVDSVPAEDLPDLIGQCARAAALAQARLTAPPSAPTPSGNGQNRLLKAQEVAEWLSFEKSWVYDHASELGAIRMSERAVRFPEKAVQRYINAKREA